MASSRDGLLVSTSSHLASRLRGGRLVLLALSMAALTLTALAQDLRVSTRTDRTSLRIGENLTFTLVISGAKSAIPQPALPPLPGFKSVGQYMTPESTPSGMALAYHYLLTPTEAGHLSVPNFDLRIGGETYPVTGFSADVETAPGRPQGRPPGEAQPLPKAGSDLLLSGSLSASRVYQGQPVIYALHLLTRRSVRGLDLVQSPDFSGFQRVEDPNATGSPTRQANREGRVYLDVVVKRAALFPLRTGRLEVGPFTAELRLEPSGTGGPQRVTVTGGQASLDVLPLPPPPPGFKGAVGIFRLASITPPPAKADMGQPFSLRLRIEGAGFLPEDPLERTSSPFFSPYPATTEDESAFSGGTYQTHRTVRLPILPKLAGDALLPPVRLVYFDPQARAYETLEAGGGKVLVTGQAASPQGEASLAPLIRSPRPGPAPKRPMAPSLFWTLLALPFAVNLLLGAGSALYKTFLLAPEKARARALARQARRGLHHARRSMDVRKADAFHDALSSALTASLDLLTARATGGLSRGQLQEALAASGMKEEDVTGVLDLREDIETARYAPERPTRQDLQARYEQVARRAKEMES